MVVKTKNNVNAVQDVADQDRTCCICASEIKIWAIGKCEHPVCYICSSRMRVLNAKEEKSSKLCAICKTEMETVVFHTSMFRFDAINTDSLDRDEASGICFFNSDSRDKFEDLLKETAPILTKGKTFVAENFEELKLHMRRKHDLHHCEICKSHYLLFPRERKWYSRKDLATHKLKGDQDDKSHKGHPQCKFCKERFLDKDELYRHLMKVHHNCHICEAKTGVKEFFDTMNDMIKHFRKDHFFCEHPDCIDNPLTSVFANETDFKLHVANKHGGIDKRDIRIDVGISRNAGDSHAVDNQRELENEFEERRNQIAPDMENEEDFPTMGGKKKSGFTFHAAKSGLPQSNSMSSRVSQGTNRNVAHQNYRSLGANKNVSSAEEFPTLGGGNARAPVNPNWKAKAIQNNKPITRPNVIASTASKKKSKAAPAPKVTIPAQNSATAALYAASQGQTWSQEPDVFVEKTQIQLEAERKAQLAEERASQARKSNAPQRDHSQFPSLGGGGAQPAAFWGVPGASIPKSNQGKKKGKQKVLARPDILPGGTVAHKPSPAKSKAQAQTAPAFPQAQHVKKEQKRVESDVRRGEANSASDLAARCGGGYSGWSAPPETFQEKSLLEIEEERRRTQPKIKNQKAPKKEEFPTLGGSKPAAPAGFWGVPGAAIKKTPGAGKGKGSKKKPASMPAKEPAAQQPAKKQTVQLNNTPKAKKSVIYSAPEPVPEQQNASQIAQRMTGGYSGWSAPPTVFVEKSLLEIQEEERQNKLANGNSQNQSVNWSPKDDREFPSFGGNFAASVPAVSGFSSALAKQQKKVNKTVEKAEKPRVEPVFQASNESEFPAFETNHQICDNGVEESSEEESDSEVDMAAVNQRLRDAIASMSAKLQDRFKICSGKFRTGQISASDYVKEGSSIMGKKNFAKLIPDLLITLPDGKHKTALAAANRQM